MSNVPIFSDGADSSSTSTMGSTSPPTMSDTIPFQGIMDFIATAPANSRPSGELKKLCILCTKKAPEKVFFIEVRTQKLVNFCGQTGLGHLIPKVKNCSPDMLPLCICCEKKINSCWDDQMKMGQMLRKIKKTHNDIMHSIKIDPTRDNGSFFHELPEALINLRIQQEAKVLEQEQDILNAAVTNHTLVDSTGSLTNPFNLNRVTETGTPNINAATEPERQRTTASVTDSNSTANVQPIISQTVKKEPRDMESELGSEDEDDVVSLKSSKKRVLVKNHEVFHSEKHPEGTSYAVFPERYKCPFCPFGVEILDGRSRRRVAPTKQIRDHFASAHPDVGRKAYTNPSYRKCPHCKRKSFESEANFKIHLKTHYDNNQTGNTGSGHTTQESNNASPIAHFSGDTRD